MQVLLFRHAKKSYEPFGDPVLTKDGLNQANALTQLISKNRLPLPTQLLVSPKTRAKQTFEKISEFLNLTLAIRDELEERKSFENSQDFRRRVQYFLNFCEDQNGILYLCTHHDWIEEAMNLIHSDVDLNNQKYNFWQPCQFMQFEIESSLWKLTRFISIEAQA